MTQPIKSAIMMAGPPEEHASLYRRIQFSVHDPVVLIEWEQVEKRILILRDIEMERAEANARVSEVHFREERCEDLNTLPEGLDWT